MWLGPRTTRSHFGGEKKLANILMVATNASLATGYYIKSRIAGLIWCGDNLILNFSKKKKKIK